MQSNAAPATPARHRPARLTPAALEAGYRWAYREFYRWPTIARASLAHDSVKHQVKHFAYAAGWKKFERAWNFVIHLRQLRYMTPVLEAVLSKVTRKALSRHDRERSGDRGAAMLRGRAW